MNETNDILSSLVLLGAIVKMGGDKFRFTAPVLAEALAGVMQAGLGTRATRPAEQRVQFQTAVGFSQTDALDSELDGRKIFVSYTQVDVTWAQWIAWTLENLGHSVIFQAWDFVPGSNFIHEMQGALESADKLIMVVSEDYLKSSFASAEWAAFLRTDPLGSERRVVPIRIRECRPAGLLGSIVFLDLVGRSEAEAQRLLTSAFESRRKPAEQPRFPRIEIAASRVPYPGSR
jgi:hypothetical protein